MFNECVRKTLGGLVEEVKTHQRNFHQVVRAIQTNEQHIAMNGAVSQEMAQFMNALIQDRENKRMWIGSLLSEFQAQAQVIRQREMGQQVLAEMVKMFVFYEHPRQHPQQQPAGGTGPVVTEVTDVDGAGQDLRSGLSPHTKPPDGWMWTVVPAPPQVPDSMEMGERP